MAKPAAAAFLEACDRLGTVPGATIHVGDNLRIDAEGPTVAGLVAVWLQRDRQSAGGVRLAIASLRQLPRLLADITVAR
ncbi:MAG: HAD hydrolase-like protein [Actinomycetota bacterium]|nr:HAD hydrolase-like protein [Actinomycetota bacterium]